MDDQTLHPAVGGKEAGYLFEFREDGVYLTIFPDAANGLMFELLDLRQVLQDNGVTDYDISRLSHIVREAAGQPAKLTSVLPSENGPEDVPEEDAESDKNDAAEEEQDAAVIVDISHDRMSVTVRYDTSTGTRLPSAEAVEQALRTAVWFMELMRMRSGRASRAFLLLSPRRGSRRAMVKTHGSSVILISGSRDARKWMSMIESIIKI